MNFVFKALLGNLLLNKGPQDLPYSLILMKLSLLVYFLSGLPGISISLSLPQSMLAMLLDVLVLLGFVYACLKAFNLQARFVQSIISLASVGTVFQLLPLPLLYQLQDLQEGEPIAPGVSIFLLILVSWNLAVIAHIFRASFNVRLLAAMALTICYIVISYLAKESIFPGLPE